MKLKTIILSICALFTTTVMADTNEVTKAFASGDIAKIENILSQNVDVMILSATNNGCDKMKAKSIINEFFRKNRPTNYSLTNKIEKGKSAVLTGKLYTNNGEFSLLLLTQKEANKDVVCQVKISETR